MNAPEKPDTFRLWKVSELEAEWERREALPIADPQNPYGFERDDKCGGWSIWWGNYEYWIDDGRLQSVEDLLTWIKHIGEKGWKGTTGARVACFIGAVQDHLREQERSE